MDKAKNYLYDQEFLKKIDEQQVKDVYAKVILLTFDENPIQELQGRITQGSINIDGTSAVRRTCSLTLLAEEMDINDYYWGIKDKFKLEVGITNQVDSRYPDIVWFPQGLFVITSLNESISSSGYTYTIQGKDKMCLLNGDLGGNLPYQVDFAKIDVYEKTGGYIEADVSELNYQSGKFFIEKTSGKYRICNDKYYNPHQKYYEEEMMITYDYVPIREIIQEAVSTYGNEDIENIFINDLENYGLELLEYKGDIPMYLVKNKVLSQVTNLQFNGDKEYYLPSGAAVKLKNIPTYDPFVNHVEGKPTIVYPSRSEIGDETKEYTVAKVEYGTTVGYYITPLTFAGELIANIGETLTSVLDKIVKMLGDFEYFYDLDGKFVFQKKHIYLQTPWNNLKRSDGNIYAEDNAYSSSYIYSFENNKLITAFQNTPALNNMKNDFSIWGVRKVTNGEIPIHMRFAIDRKPTFYRSIKVASYDKYINGKQAEPQMSEIFLSDDYNDYRKEYTHLPRYDWREIVYRMALDYFKYHHNLEDFKHRIADANFEFYPLGTTGYERYYTDIKEFWRELYDPDVPSVDYDAKTYWNQKVLNNPENLIFWFDFMDDEGEMGQYSNKAIGNRPKAINDNTVSAIYFRDVPQVLYLSDEDYDNLNQTDDLLNYSGYTFIKRTTTTDNYFTISAQGKSAQEALDSLLYEHTYMADNVSITSLPIYYLQPNYRIFVHDEKTGINGEYIVKKLTVPLTYNGTMSITASKAVTRIY